MNKANKSRKLKNYKKNKEEKEDRPMDREDQYGLNKERVEKELAAEGEDDYLDINYDPEWDPVPAVIFDTELQFIKKLKAVDIVFLIDSTASMSSYFKGVKRFVRKVLWDAEKCLTQFLIDELDILSVGLVTYKDHSDENKYYLTKIDCNLTSDLKQFTDILMKISAQGGSDEPEAVLDGLNAAVNNISWREKSFKFLYHILDGPPHGKNFNNIKEDNYENCPCELNYEDILRDMRNKDIEYTIIKLNESLNLMVKAFEDVYKIDVLCPEIKGEQKVVSQYI